MAPEEESTRRTVVTFALPPRYDDDDDDDRKEEGGGVDDNNKDDDNDGVATTSIYHDDDGGGRSGYDTANMNGEESFSTSTTGRTTMTDDGTTTTASEQQQQQQHQQDQHQRPMYIPSSSNNQQQEWELTWPIWHMLPRMERKELANRYGYKTIGEFEEYMSLRKAVDLSEDIGVVGGAGGVGAGAGAGGGEGKKEEEEKHVYVRLSEVHEKEMETRKKRIEEEKKMAVAAAAALDDDDDYSSEDEEFVMGGDVGGATTAAITMMMGSLKVDDDDDEAATTTTTTTRRRSETIINGKDDEDTPSSTLLLHHHDNPSSDKMLSDGGYMITHLPNEMHHRILSYCHVSDYYSCALVHPSWNTFTRTEHTYEILCKRCYLSQSHRKTLHIKRWGNTYRNMLTYRPRVRAGGGLYILKYSHVKKIQRDMWTEVPVGAVLETIYYRYVLFHENGKCLYSLTPRSPHEMIPRFVRRQLTGEEDEKMRVVVGRYEIKKDVVRVYAEHSWCKVAMEMQVLVGDGGGSIGVGGDNESIWTTEKGAVGGRFTTMKFLRHRSCPLDKNFDDDDAGGGGSCASAWHPHNHVTEYDVPNELFRFLPDKRL